MDTKTNFYPILLISLGLHLILIMVSSIISPPPPFEEIPITSLEVALIESPTASADKMNEALIMANHAQQGELAENAPETSSKRSNSSNSFLLNQSLKNDQLIDMEEENLAVQPQNTQKTDVQHLAQNLQQSATRHALEAAYVKSWISHIEAWGNQHSELLKKPETHRQLQLLVTILSSGKVKKIKILQSSGSRILDEQAVRIVYQAAPFAAFDQAMQNSMNEIDILRTWEFHPQTLN